MSKTSHGLYLAGIGILIIAIVAIVGSKAPESASEVVVVPANHRFVIFPFSAADPSAHEIAEALSSLVAESLEGHTSIELIPATEFMSEVDSSDHQRWTNQYHVSYVLEGAVKRQGDNVRITVQLIDGRSNFHIWSEAYDTKADQVERVAASIGTNIVSMVSR